MILLILFECDGVRFIEDWHDNINGKANCAFRWQHCDWTHNVDSVCCIGYDSEFRFSFSTGCH